LSYQELSAYSAELELDYNDDEAEESWAGSPFAWIRTLPPRTKGAVGVRLAQRVLQDAGVASTRIGSQLRVGTQRIAVKYSMEWTAGGFKFEQFKDTAYDFILCLGVEPEAAYGWLIPRSEVIENGVWQEREGLGGQHRGQAAIDTYWLSISPGNAPAWLQPHGGPITQLETVLVSTFLP
jgi:hypothetical protein